MRAGREEGGMRRQAELRGWERGGGWGGWLGEEGCVLSHAKEAQRGRRAEERLRRRGI